MSDLSGLNPTPHAIAVYASRPLSPGVTQHSLPSGRCPLLGPVFHRLDRTSLPGALIRSPRRRWLAALAAPRLCARHCPQWPASSAGLAHPDFDPPPLADVALSVPLGEPTVGINELGAD